MWSYCAEFQTRTRYYSCMNEENPIKNVGARVLTRLYIVFFFFRSSRAAISEVSGGILPKFELIQFFMVVLVTCKNEEEPESKMKALECYQDFPQYKSIGFFSNAQGQLTPQSVVKSCRISNSSEIL